MTQQRLDACFARCKAEGRAASSPMSWPETQTRIPPSPSCPACRRRAPTSSSWACPSPIPWPKGRIQRAAQRALKQGITVAKRWRSSAAFRKTDKTTPIVLMGYLNPILSRGYDRFAIEAAEAGVDGLIVVDCPPEEADPLADPLDKAGVSLIRLATPTTDANACRRSCAAPPASSTMCRWPG